jgi:alkylation response protein AidB-like acyl-CoA dehydrogenase
MEFSWPDGIDALRSEAAEVGRRAASEYVDYAGVECSREFSLELGRRGWLGMTWPVEAGGHGRSPLERFVVAEALIAAGAPMGRTYISDRQIGPALLRFGSLEQQQRFLPPIVSGEACWCIGLSESEAGSDVSSIRTSGRLEGNHYVVSGRKIWTSFASEAEYIYLIAKTEHDTPAHGSLSELIVPLDSPGVTVSRIRDMGSGERFCEVSFEEVRVPVDAIVGKPGGAFRQVMRQLEHERGSIDRLVTNRRLFLAACDAADLADASVRNEIAELEAAYKTGRLLALRSMLENAPQGYSAVTKVYCSELQQRVADFAEGIFGVEAVIDGPVSRALCVAPSYSIQGGTSEVLRNVIAERMLGLPR